MANAKAKISLAASCDIPFQQLQLSQANVRRVKADSPRGRLAGAVD